ncbi:hypothetical protein EAI_02528 [Harpegnathos saltator]|uniref:Uncharacterized protein n=1 Tax=Harpegnathos saltator TaxID=610380 RepID=E2BAW1_HARSA|nr:hypothetical protein EAI_02528 [Harpegnathos saltator]
MKQRRMGFRFWDKDRYRDTEMRKVSIENGLEEEYATLRRAPKSGVNKLTTTMMMTTTNPPWRFAAK